MSEPARRCIWLTEIEARSHLLYPRWLAATPDPVRAVRLAVVVPASASGYSSEEITDAVLQALAFGQDAPLSRGWEES